MLDQVKWGAKKFRKIEKPRCNFTLKFQNFAIKGEDPGTLGDGGAEK